MPQRIKSIQSYLAEHRTDAALISQPENRRYYSGFTGSTGYVLVTGDAGYFVTDFRYTEQASKECPGLQVISIDPERTIFHVLRDHHISTLAVEEDFVSITFASQLQELADVQLVGDIGPVTRTDRWIKDAEEVARIRRACEITDAAFEHILGFIRDGVTEAEINFELQYFMKRYSGVEKMADNFIIASGLRGSMPHGIATGKVVRTGEFVTMDFGCNYLGYWSDLTRTICVGKASDAQRDIYHHVLEAQKLALNAVRPGLTGRQIDRIARDHIASCGHGAHFGHGLGHSFGLEIHEAPRCAQTAQGEIALQPGMIMTIEPGIYIEGFGGVRIEDDILITEAGCEVLSRCSRELIEL